jgi:hypothetical protein
VCLYQLPWGRGLINYQPEEEALALETYQTWMRLFELQKYYSWVVDRFHISTQAYQLQTYGKAPDFSWLEERLNAINFCLIFCHRTLESFAFARQERLKVSGNPSQYDNLETFIREQELMEELVSKSTLPTFRVDISDSDIPKAVTAIVDWMEFTGGLSMED